MRSRGTETMLIDPPDRVDRGDDHRVGEIRLPGRTAVDPDQQHAQPLVVPRPRSGWRARRPGRREARRSGRTCRGTRSRTGTTSTWGTATNSTMAARPDQADAARGTPVAGVEEGLADGEEAPAQEQEVDRQERRQHGRGDDEGRQPGERLRRIQEESQEQEHERRDQEHRREAGPPVERLTESREHRRKTGRGEAAAVEMSGVRPDSAGVHDGRWSSIRWVVGPRGSLPGSGRGDAGRSISLP